MLDSIILSEPEEEWHTTEILRKETENMSRHLLIADFSDEHISTNPDVPSKSLEFFQVHQEHASLAGLCLMITPDGKPPQGIRIPHHYTVVSLLRYQILYEPLVEALQEVDGWSTSHCTFEPHVHYREARSSLLSSYVFTQYTLESTEIVRTLSSPQLLFRNLERNLRLHFENKGNIGQAQVYLTPLIEGAGFVHQMGEQYELTVQEEKLNIPLSIKEFPIPSWHYRVDMHMHRNDRPEYQRFSMVVLDAEKIDHMTVIQFPEASDHSGNDSLLERARQHSYCEEGKYCPLLVINPPGGVSGNNHLPLRAVVLSLDDAEHLPVDMFAGIRGVIWQTTGENRPPQAMSGFAQFTVTTKTRQRRNSL